MPSPGPSPAAARGSRAGRRFAAFRFAVGFALAMLASACHSRVDDGSPRLVVLYATCTLNKNFLAPYNSSVPFTPALASLGQSAMVFDRHVTEAGQSGIAFASIFSGMQAPGHGIFSHPNRISNNVQLITEAFAGAGYDTYSFLGQHMASAGLNYAQGVPRAKAQKTALTSRNRVFAGILQQLEDDPGYKAFIVTNFTVTHAPYHGARLDDFCRKYPGECAILKDRTTFDRLRRVYARNSLPLSWDFDATVKRLRFTPRDIENLSATLALLYKADVNHLDRMLGDVVDAIRKKGLLGRSLLAFTADHGEIHYRENAFFKWTHGYQLVPEYLGVPLMIAGQGIQPGRYAAVTRSIDVFPTLAGLAGVALPANDKRGVDLSAAVLGKAPQPHLLAFSHTTLYDPPQWLRYRKYETLRELFPTQDPDEMWASLRDGDRFVKRWRDRSGTWQTSLYDLASDAGETKNLFDPADPEQAALAEALTKYRRELVTAAAGRRETVAPEKALEKLRSLGYVE